MKQNPAQQPPPRPPIAAMQTSTPGGTTTAVKQANLQHQQYQQHRPLQLNNTPQKIVHANSPSEVVSNANAATPSNQALRHHHGGVVGMKDGREHATISHSIMAAHGASSTAFLQHLQQTWDLHNSMQAETSVLKQELAKLRREKALLQQENAALLTTSTTQSSELARLRESNLKIKMEVSGMRDQLVRVANSAKAVQEKAKADKLSSRKRLKEASEIIESLRDEVEATAKDLAKQTKRAESAEQERDQALGDSDKIAKAHDAALKELRALRMVEDEMSTHLQQVVDRLQNSEKSQGELKKKLASAEEKIREAGPRLEKEKLSFQDRLEDALTRAELAEQRAAGAEQRLEALQDELAEVDRAMRQDREDAAEDIQIARREVDSRAAEAKECRGELAKAQESLKNAEARIVDLEQVLDETRRDVDEDSSKTKAQMEAAVQRISALTEAVDEKDRLLQELEEALLDASKRQATCNTQLEKDGLKIRGLTAALEKTSEGARALQEAAQAASKRLVRAVEERDAFATKNQKLMQALEAKKVRLDGAKERVVELETELSNVSAKIESQESARIKAEHQCTQLERTLGRHIEEAEARELELKNEVSKTSSLAKEDMNKKLKDLNEKLAKAQRDSQKYLGEYKEVERERDSAKVTLEAAVTKLEQVTEELGRRIQSETVLGEEIGAMRDRMKVQERRAAAALERVQKESDARAKECDSLSKNLAESREARAQKQEELNQAQKLLDEMRDETAKQVLAFRKHSDELAEEVRSSEQSAEDTRAQLRKTKSLLSDAVRTIETLKSELQADDQFRTHSAKDSERLTNQIEMLGKQLSQSKAALRSAQSRCSMHQEEARRAKESRDRMAKELESAHTDMEQLQNTHDETRRSLLHLQRCARNAETIENNAAKFLRGSGHVMSTTKTGQGPPIKASGNSISSKPRQKRNSRKVNTGEQSSLPDIASPRPVGYRANNATAKKKGVQNVKYKTDSMPFQVKDTNQQSSNRVK